MRTVGVSFAIVCGLITVGASAQQTPSTSTARSAPSPENSKKQPQYDTGTLPKPAPGTILRGATVYVYSFLDVRAVEMGQRMVDQINGQLESALAGATVQSKFLLFKNTNTDHDDILAAQRSSPTSGLFPYGSQDRKLVPVMATIAQNVPDEIAIGAKYRLVMLPSYMSQVGYYRTLDVDWRLIDIQTGKPIWVFSTTDRIYQWGKRDDNAQARASAMIEKAMASLRSYGLVN